MVVFPATPARALNIHKLLLPEGFAANASSPLITL